ncbi:DUF2897 family protein [Halopseudomonas salegens]|uniref:DUF2897 family protein n=1 Tax=Halopseudomonas salegens TaxID=1434072 RepID=A0A1H2FP85_9GAMM|nr:DUF2897 family protein [Halopseudomonas salegens]SDU09150.1 Protein of unknown function [Halopseudomonas salegens]
MPAIGWIFIILAFGMVLSSLLLLRDSANTMPISPEKLARIKERQAQLEAEEAKEKQAEENRPD